MNYNRIIMTGHLTKDPNLRTLAGGSTVCDFGLANNRKWTDSGGNKKEEVCFVDCSAWGKTGENIRNYFVKGNPILIEGRLTYESWETEDGTKRSRHKITVERFDFIGKKEESETPSNPPEAQPASAAADDDIPF